MDMHLLHVRVLRIPYTYSFSMYAHTRVWIVYREYSMHGYDSYTDIPVRWSYIGCGISSYKSKCASHCVNGKRQQSSPVVWSGSSFHALLVQKPVAAVHPAGLGCSDRKDMRLHEFNAWLTACHVSKNQLNLPTQFHQNIVWFNFFQVSN